VNCYRDLIVNSHVDSIVALGAIAA